VKTDIENIRGLKLAVVKLMTVQVNRQPLQHKIRVFNTAMICSAKPVLTDDLRVVKKHQ
jgi:hypothetical protein